MEGGENQRIYRIDHCGCCKTSRLFRCDGPQFLDGELLYYQYCCTNCGATRVFEKTTAFIEMERRLLERELAKI